MLPVHAAIPSITTILRCRRRSVRPTNVRKQTDRKRRTKLDTRVTQSLAAGCPSTTAGRRERRPAAALHAATGGANDRFKDLVRGAALVPNVELHQHADLCSIDVAGNRYENRLGIGKEFETYCRER